jgi:ankyrin repeat protein
MAIASGEPELVAAAKRDDGDAVATLLSRGGNANAEAADGTTALHWAVHRGNAAAVEALLARGAAAGAATQLGITPIDLACLNADATMVRRLLDAGAPANTGARVPSIMVCARTGSVDAVAALLARGANPNATEGDRQQTALMWAAAQGHTAVVRKLIAAGANVQMRTRTARVRVNRGSPAADSYLTPSVTDVTEGGSTALLMAARNGHTTAARELLAAGANANDADAEGVSPLILALFGGHHDLTTTLIDAGADVNDLRAGYAPLHVAVLRGDRGFVAMLLAHGAHPNVRIVHGTPVTRNSTDLALPDTTIGATPFWLAAKFLEAEIMRTLARAGADARLASVTGDDPLMVAAGVLWSGVGFDRRDRIALRGSPEEPQEAQVSEAVRVALDLGCDVKGVDAAGSTAMTAAKAFGYRAVEELLSSRAVRLGLPGAGKP